MLFDDRHHQGRLAAVVFSRIGIGAARQEGAHSLKITATSRQHQWRFTRCNADIGIAPGSQELRQQRGICMARSCVYRCRAEFIARLCVCASAQ